MGFDDLQALTLNGVWLNFSKFDERPTLKVAPKIRA
jgi:hypothetical protein